MNSPAKNITETDLSFSAPTLPVGRSGFMGITKRGPINDPSILITSWPMFVKIYGGLVAGNEFPTLCKRALDGGSSLRIANIKHYTDISDPGSYDAAFAAITATKTYVLSAGAGVGHSLVFTIGVDVVTTPYAVSALNTMELFVAAIKAQWPNTVEVIDSLTSATFLKVTVQTGSGALTTTGAGAPTVTTTTRTGLLKGATALADFTPKYPGLDYNNLRIEVKGASNGASDQFDIVISMIGDSTTTETYKNLKITGAPTDLTSDYLKKIVDGSDLVDVVYHDISALAAPIVPDFTIMRYAGGTDGTTPTDADYIGDSSGKNGLHAFDSVDDIMQIASVGSDAQVTISGAAYAANRGDLMFFAHLSNTLDSEAALTAAKLLLGIDTSYVAFFAGGVKAVNLLNSQEEELSEIGDILGLVAKADAEPFGPWYSFSGARRGLLNGILDVVNNFGTPANVAGMDLLANYQINTVINRGGRKMLWGSFTGQLSESKLSLINVRRFVIHLKKTLGPMLERYIEEPNDIVTWKRLYMEVKPLLDGFADKRALIGKENQGWSWQGDQFANTEDDYQINNPTDVGLGKYKVRLFIKPVPSLQQIQLDITISPSGVSFEEVQTQLF